MHAAFLWISLLGSLISSFLSSLPSSLSSSQTLKEHQGHSLENFRSDIHTEVQDCNSIGSRLCQENILLIRFKRTSSILLVALIKMPTYKKDIFIAGRTKCRSPIFNSPTLFLSQSIYMKYLDKPFLRLNLIEHRSSSLPVELGESDTVSKPVVHHILTPPPESVLLNQGVIK